MGNKNITHSFSIQNHGVLQIRYGSELYGISAYEEE